MLELITIAYNRTEEGALESPVITGNGNIYDALRILADNIKPPAPMPPPEPE